MCSFRYLVQAQIKSGAQLIRRVIIVSRYSHAPSDDHSESHATVDKKIHSAESLRLAHTLVLVAT